jgi:hypothetical protein
MSAAAGAAAVARSPLLGGFGGFGKVSVRLCLALVATHLLSRLFPPTVKALALVPANTVVAHFFVWNLITAAFLETSAFGTLCAPPPPLPVSPPKLPRGRAHCALSGAACPRAPRTLRRAGVAWGTGSR